MTSSGLATVERPRAGFDLREIRPDSPITIPCGDGHLTMSVQNVVDWIAPGAPITDAMRFLMVCRSTRLNPLLGEILLVKMGKNDPKFSVVVPKSGLLKSAQSRPDYAGHESGITCWDGSDFRDIAGMIRPPVQGVSVVGGWARVWRRGVDQPFFKRVGFDEYKKQTYIWDSIPMTMICKVALAAALREAFNLGESYDDSEVGYVVDSQTPAKPPDNPPVATPAELPFPYTLDKIALATAFRKKFDLVNPADNPPAKVVHVPELPAPETTPEAAPVRSYRMNDTIGFVNTALLDRIVTLTYAVGMTHDDVRSMLSRRGAEHAGDLTVAQAEEIVARLEGVLREREATEVFGPTASEAETVAPETKSEDIVLPEVTRPESRDEAAPSSPVVQISGANT